MWPMSGLPWISGSMQRTGSSLDLEATLVHARNLTEFFWSGRSPHQDGVCAKHYLPSWDTQSLPQLPNERYGAMSNQLVHISVHRSSTGSPRDFANEIGKIAAALRQVWELWQNALQSTEWNDLLESAVNRWRTGSSI